MLDDVTKKRINTLRQILVGKLPDPKAQVEQITNGLIYKFMNDMDEQSVSIGGKSTYFSGKFQKYSWKNLMDTKTSGVEKIKLYSEAVEQMYTNENLPELFREIFKNSFLPFKDPSTLNMFLKEINEFHYSHSEKLGDAFEYLLSFMGSQGDAGQFRTPRHIIDFIVKVVNPKKNETILDPACGTAGFLISSYKHILNQNTKKNLGDGLTASDRKKIGENLNGYDISPDMVKMSLVNMYLHKFTNPKINEYDTLSSEERWNEYYDVILANPPFFSPRGGITPHNRFGVKSSRAEVLFVDYINQHLKPKGRSAIIVPEGIIFQGGKAYRELRKNLINTSLAGIISLPQGVFQPYSGVKTSVLVLDKRNINSDYIFFSKVSNDGFSLTSARKKVSEKSDLDEIKVLINQFFEDKNKENNEKFFTIKKNEILNEEDYSLNQLIYYKKNNEKNTKVKKIGEFIEESTERYSDGEKNVLSISNKYGFIKPEEIFSHQIASEDIKNYKRVEKDYFAYNPSRINVGSIALYNLNKTAYVSPMYVVFKNNKKEILNNEYLYHFLKSKKGNELIIANSIGSIRNTLKFKNLSNIEISIPSIDEQNSKVDELNSYQTIINNCYEIIENYKPKIDTAENWNISKLKDLAEFTYGLGASAEDNGRYRFIRITDIDDKGLLINEEKKFFNIKDDEKKYILNKGDVLIARTGATYGKCLYFNSDEPSIYAGYLIKVSLDLNKVLPKFFWIYCQTQDFLIQKKQLVVGGGQPQFNANTLGEVKIIYPSLDEQKMIIEKIEKEQKIIFSNYELVRIFQNKIDEIFS